MRGDVNLSGSGHSPARMRRGLTGRRDAIALSVTIDDIWHRSAGAVSPICQIKQFWGQKARPFPSLLSLIGWKLLICWNVRIRLEEWSYKCYLRPLSVNSFFLTQRESVVAKCFHRALPAIAMPTAWVGIAAMPAAAGSA